MAVLVTGGTGYIGSHTAVELLEAGKEIVIVDNFSNSKPEVLDAIKQITNADFKFYKADILNETAMDDIFSENQIDSVIHFAGYKAVGESVEKPLEYYINNISGTLALCSIMKKHSCKTIVFSSSATVYGMNNEVPFKEEYPTSATNPYGQTKLMIEQILRDLYVSDNEWNIALLRYFNPVGAHISGLIGEDPQGIPNNLVPYIAKVATGELPHLNVFGNDYDTPDGTGVRDYIHVVDLAQGHLRALECMEGKSGVLTLNLGTGRGYSVLEVLRAYEKASGKTIDYKIKPRRPGDIATALADPSKSANILNWKADKTIDDMCVDSWNFITNLNNKGE